MEETVRLVSFCLGSLWEYNFFPFFKVSLSERYYVCGTSHHMDEQKVQNCIEK